MAVVDPFQANITSEVNISLFLFKSMLDLGNLLIQWTGSAKAVLALHFTVGSGADRSH